MPTTTPTAAPTTGRATPLRAVALLLALAWSTLGFATTDLWVVIPPGHPLFAADEAMLEAGWGISFTCLVVLPLLVLVLRPELGRAVAVQLAVVAACTVPVAALALDPTLLLLLGAVLAATGAAVGWLARAGRRRRPGDPRRLTLIWAAVTLVVFAGVPWVGFMRTSGDFYPDGSRNGAVLVLATVAAAWLVAAVVGEQRRGGQVPSSALPLPRHRRGHLSSDDPGGSLSDVRGRPAGTVLAVVAVGAGPWSVYVWHLGHAGRYVDSYLTNGIDHWPAQAACALAVLVLPVLAAFGRGPVRLATSTAGLTGLLLGVFSLLYPDVGASLGPVWGVLSVVWGVALIGAGLLFAGRRERMPFRPGAAGSRQAATDTGTRAPSSAVRRTRSRTTWDASSPTPPTVSEA
ncbi:hypothetical protein [Georgenia sp. SUBG003]|uniref:hypothetical protein n=1 Tax=Georgenia sp. SUBG003 TaxID=1497974 RepID=UPI0004D433F6|nr:hypothetical protein DA06_22930 [Georgenia sp. SUBG003]